MSDTPDTNTPAPPAPPAAPAPTGGMEQFFTRDRANEGIELPLYIPGGGDSGHRIRIRGVDSDEFRSAKTEEERAAFHAAVKERKPWGDDEIENSALRLLSSLVISWTLPEVCTRENVIRFLRNAPQIRDKVDEISSQRARFFGNRSTV